MEKSLLPVESDLNEMIVLWLSCCALQPAYLMVLVVGTDEKAKNPHEIQNVYGVQGDYKQRRFKICGSLKF